MRKDVWYGVMSSWVKLRNFQSEEKNLNWEIIVPNAMAERSSRQRRERGAVPKAQANARGVRGHAPPENFCILDANLCNLVPSDQLFIPFEWRKNWMLFLIETLSYEWKFFKLFLELTWKKT